MLRALAVLVVGTVALGAVWLRPAIAAEGPTSAEIFARVSPAVAIVKNDTGHGSGMLIDATHLMTDAHVVGEFPTMEVVFPDGTTVPKARVVVRDLLVDMAILEIPSSAIAPVVMAPPPPVGSDLYSIGYPGSLASGKPQPVLTRGLVSQLATWDAASVRYVRTDAAGEPGLSGGPLIDTSGNVVGIVQTGSASGRFVFGAGTQDLLARARQALAGVNVNGIVNRAPAGTPGQTFTVNIGGYDAPQETFLIRPVFDGTITVTAAASGTSTPNASMIVWSSDDAPFLPTAIGAIDASNPTKTVSFDGKAGQSYWFEIRTSRRMTFAVSASTNILRINDPDQARMSAGFAFGVIDFAGDLDCRPFALRMGQKVTATADSTLVSPSLTLVSPAGVPVRTQTKQAGFLGQSPQITYTAGTNGDYTICVGAEFAEGAGAYSLTAEVEAAPAQSGAGRFTTLTTQLLQPRANQFVGVLHDGRVFIADGTLEGSARLSTAELFDPVAKTVRAVEARDVVERYDPTGVVMPDGRVLLLGGVLPNGTPTSAASIWNPTDGSWKATGALNRARAYAEAIEMQDGRILVFTGEDANGDPMASAEIYDPASGQFTTTGALITARVGLYATLLPDGRVLAAGGRDTAGKVIRSVEVYNPRTGAFSEVGNLATARYNHSTALLPSGLVLIAGGSDGTANLATAELFDPLAGTSRTIASLRIARQGMSTTVLRDGRVLIAGGANPSRSATTGPEEMSIAEVFDPRSETFLFVGGFDQSRFSFGEGRLLADDSVLFAGGRTLRGRLASMETFVPRVGPAGFATPPAFAGDAKQAAAVFLAGGVGDLESAAASAGATGVWAQDSAGVFRLLVVSGASFLNEGFSAAFPGGFGSPTAVTLIR